MGETTMALAASPTVSRSSSAPPERAAATSDKEPLLLREKSSASEDSDSFGPNGKSPTRVRVVQLLKNWWKPFVVFLIPILLLPIPISLGDSASRAAYVIAIMAVYWMTEVVPIAVTSLLPLILFPALGVLTARETAWSYLNDNAMLYVGGLMVAVAIEKWNLHLRVALLVLMAVGTRPMWLLFGLMCTTAFLSMWISNTATSVMMLPIAIAVLKVFREEQSTAEEARPSGKEDRTSGKEKRSSKKEAERSLSKEERYFGKQSNGETQYKSTGTQGIELPTRELESVAEREEQLIQQDNTAQQTSKRMEVTQDTKLNTQSSKSEADQHHQNSDNDKSQSSDVDGALLRLSKALVLGVAYSANIGGTATLTGTLSNIVLSGDVESLFPTSPGVNFGLWFAFAFPAMLLALFCSWLYLSLLYCDDCFRWLKKRIQGRTTHAIRSERAKDVIREQYKKLGSLRYVEVQLLALFLILVLLWLLRDPGFIPGWGELFKTDQLQDGRSYISDSSTVLFIVFLLFILPSMPPFTFNRTRTGHCCTSNCAEGSPPPRILDWDTVQRNFPWDLVFLVGAGFALAAGAQKSCLSAQIGGLLLGLQKLPVPVIALLVSIIMATITELLSNAATTTLILPVLAQLGVDLHINPLYLMVPAAFSASFAFMLPVASPPNAIAFSYGHLRVRDMAVTGFFMNILCVAIVALALNTTGMAIFGLGSFPNWANTSSLAVGGACEETSTNSTL